MSKRLPQIRSHQSLIAACLQFLLCIASCVGCAYAVDSAADPSKVLHVVFEAADDGFDAVRTTSYYSGFVNDVIFERLLTYDYMARPVKLVPGTAESVPTVAKDGKTYVFHVKKGIYFSPDPVFKGVRRELTAHDYAYTFKRMLDPANRSPAANFLSGKIVGLDELAEKSKKTGHFDYDAEVAGLQVPDRYTLRVQLNQADSNFLYTVAYASFGAVAREAIEAYGLQTGAHPVGTGPYMLQQYVPRSKIVVVANPLYRGFVWDFASAGDPGDDKIVREMRGKKMPQIGRVEINVIEEEQSRWLAFQDGQIDLDAMPQSASPTVLDGDKLKPEFAKKGILLSRYIEPEITYEVMNLKDPIIGGMAKEKIALRRAIAMSYSVQNEITQLRMGQAVKAEMVVPPGIIGHDPAYRSSIRYDIPLANKLLDRFGYKRGPDGIRTLPDGKPLKLDIRGEGTTTGKIIAEIWKRGLDQLGINAEYTSSSFADNLKAATECKLMMWGGAWLPDIPDGENFLQLLYGPNAGRGNHGCYQSAAYDALYTKAIALPPGAKRNGLYLQMNRQMEADTAWVLQTSRIRNWLARPWVKGFKKHPVLHATWPFMDIEKH